MMVTDSDDLAEKSNAGVPRDNHVEPNGRWFMLAIAALGVVFGDIGTSPLYAVRECFQGAHALEVSPANILGMLSLIFWALTLIISLKYLVFILRADNQGEGGILALVAMLNPGMKTSARRGVIVTLGLAGATFLYADGMITPAISVLSAVEGLELATPIFKPYVELIAVVILIGLFCLQARGTATVGALFGPLMFIWFLLIAALGVWHIAERPDVLAAIDPSHAWRFFQGNGWAGFVILGTVFLVVTGGEALYADIGHFGKLPIRISWFTLVFPALLLNYFGQGSLLLNDPSAAENPFFRMAPNWALYPLIAIATMAAVVASQAIITGSFSLTLQAIQLGYCPPLRIEHTSSEHIGQIYIPTVNWMLMVATIALVLGFHNSTNLAAAYGVAITITMVITTILFFVLIKDHWKWPLVTAVLLAGFFLVIDLSFLGANLIKVTHGGWFPLLIAATVYLLMSTWHDGRQRLAARVHPARPSLESFIAELKANPPARVRGTAIFMASTRNCTPLALQNNVIHNHVLHEQNIIVTVETAPWPYVSPKKRLESEEIQEDISRAILTYGFKDEPNVPRDLLPMMSGRDLGMVSYFVGRETAVTTTTPMLLSWREKLFSWMSRNANAAPLFFHLPSERVIEIGAEVEL
jgi:KUP system potassium uptake protein